jgi:hypothetical protein
MEGASELVMHITKPKTPTGQSYGEFLRAYRFFNKALFAGELPHCLITLHRHRSAYGYFWGDRYAADGGVVTDEIAMNPDHLRTRPDRIALSTLVHEMAHLWQHHFGKSSRNGYHNKEWAAKMDELGLAPSATAAPGGARTGQRVSHYIVDGGPFDRSCKKLLDAGFRISWGSKPAVPKASKSGARTKYTCPECSASVWGKSGLNVGCEDCGTQMETE